ncbi:MAG: hypothetical protein ACI9ON_003243 [Limisphaerales bacterium]|jgi:hypothetical protein
MRYLITLLSLMGLLTLLGCGEPDAGTDTQAPEPHVLKGHEDALQRAKDAAKALEEAGVRTESAIEKSTSE